MILDDAAACAGPSDDIATAALIDRLAAMDLKWGEGNGT